MLLLKSCRSVCLDLIAALPSGQRERDTPVQGVAISFSLMLSSRIQNALAPVMCAHKLVDFSLSMQAGVAVLQCP